MIVRVSSGTKDEELFGCSTGTYLQVSVWETTFRSNSILYRGDGSEGGYGEIPLIFRCRLNF